jgi:hypothetical protein
MFPPGLGMRIGLVLASQALASSVTGTYADREARKDKAPPGRPQGQPAPRSVPAHLQGRGARLRDHRLHLSRIDSHDLQLPGLGRHDRLGHPGADDGPISAILYGFSALAQLKWRWIDHCALQTPRFVRDMAVAVISLVFSVLFI